MSDSRPPFRTIREPVDVCEHCELARKPLVVVGKDPNAVAVCLGCLDAALNFGMNVKARLIA